MATYGSLREMLRDPKFARALRAAHERLHNDEKGTDAFVESLREISDALGDHRSDLQTALDEINLVVIGGGSALATGGVLSIPVWTFPPLAVLPIAGGAYAVWRGILERRQIRAKTDILAKCIEYYDTARAGIEEQK